MDDVVNELIKAIDDHRHLMIIYNGGTNPGASREIIPIQISGEKLKARTPEADFLKEFYLDKISIISENGEIIGNPPAPQTTPQIYINIDDFLIQKKSHLESLGWFVTHQESYDEGGYGKSQSVTLHRIRKNGTPLKGADASLAFTEFSYDYVYDEGQNPRIDNRKKRVKPWTISAKNKNTITCAKFDHAIDSFLRFAEELSTAK